MRTALTLIVLSLSALPLVTASPLELDPRNPENGCIALCGCCPCPCKDIESSSSSSAVVSSSVSSTKASSAPSSDAVSSAGKSSSKTSASVTPASGSAAQPSDFNSGEEPYHVVPSDAANAENVLGTWLYGYDGCKKKNSAYKGNIDEAYYDSWTMANVQGVKSDINWNEAVSWCVHGSHSFAKNFCQPALEFLGAPGANQPQQAQIQAVLANVATVIYSYKNPFFQHYIHVRCDDPGRRCENRPDNDPCDPE